MSGDSVLHFHIPRFVKNVGANSYYQCRCGKRTSRHTFPGLVGPKDKKWLNGGDWSGPGDRPAPPRAIPPEGAVHPGWRIPRDCKAMGGATHAPKPSFGTKMTWEQEAAVASWQGCLATLAVMEKIGLKIEKPEGWRIAVGLAQEALKNLYTTGVPFLHPNDRRGV